MTALNGLAYLAAAAALDSLLGLPEVLLRAVGVFLIIYGAMVLLVAVRRVVRSIAVRALITLNALWAFDSLVLVAAGWFSPTWAGNVWILVQAVIVAAFAALRRHQEQVGCSAPVGVGRPAVGAAGSNGTQPRTTETSGGGVGSRQGHRLPTCVTARLRGPK